jgi:predicted Rossmann fold flavoprotein
VPSDVDYDIAIIGAGPSGLLAAIAAAQAGAKVVLCDRMDRPGVKLLATGGGRCNLTNTADAGQFIASFGKCGRFTQPALARLDNQALRDFFRHLGVETACHDNFHVFPASNKAGDVLSALLTRCHELGATILTSAPVTQILLSPGRPAVCGLAIGSGLHKGEIRCHSVILAAGGKSYPTLGSDGSGLALAQQAGLAIVPPSPALVPLICKEDWIVRCAGISISPATIWIDLPGQSKAGLSGDLLFTHTGISGPVVLDLSAGVAQLLQSQKNRTVPVRISLTPSRDAANWRRLIDTWANSVGTRPIGAMLARETPARLADQLCRLAGISEITQVCQVDRSGREKIVSLVTGLPLGITGTETFAKAMVTRGGVSLKQVDPHSLQCKLIAGLFFAGEVLDLDGPCGGYNLQWAFSSGYLAGQSAAGLLKSLCPMP